MSESEDFAKLLLLVRSVADDPAAVYNTKRARAKRRRDEIARQAARQARKERHEPADTL